MESFFRLLSICSLCLFAFTTSKNRLRTRSLIVMKSNFKLPPGKAQWPIFGDTFQLINSNTMASYQTKSREKFGDIWKTSIFFKPTIFVSGEENLKIIFSEEAKKQTSAFFPPHHQKLFGKYSLLVQSGSYHKKLRRVIQQSLSPQVISQLNHFIEEESKQFVLDCKSKVGTFKFVDNCRQFFIKMAVKILLGNSIPRQDLISLTSDISLWSKGLLAAPITLLPWTTASRALRARERISKKLSNIIASYKNDENQDRQDTDSVNLLSRLITTKDDVDNNYLSADEIIDNIFTLIFAGSDTTASTMTSIIMRLSLDQKLQQQLRDDSLCLEEKDILLNNLILEVFSESPPAPFAMRLVGDECLRVNNFEIPPNWLVAYGFAGTLLERKNRSSSEENSITSSKPENNIAFGGGPRMCPGRYLAIREIKTFLIEILSENGLKWQIIENQNLNLIYSPGYFPIDGLIIKVE